MDKFLRFITNRITIVGILILLQLFVFGFLIISASQYAKPILYTLEILSFVVVFFVLVSNEQLIYKIAWIIPILIAPIFGGFFFILFKQHKLSNKTYKRFNDLNSKRQTALAPFMGEVPIDDPFIQKQIKHLNADHWPVFTHTKVTFIPSGEVKLIRLLETLERAQSFIFIEYFIINLGQVWDQVFEILQRKVKDGVKVIVMYDDFGSSPNLPNHFDKDLRKAGIEVVQFNPMKPRINLSMNYRDHRKMVIVDGKIGITGGMNLADEYMNLIKRFGHWQDASIMLEGRAVYALTQTFLQTYRYYAKHDHDIHYYQTYDMPSDGYIIPFSDSPLDKNHVTKHAYMQMIQYAKKRIIITTPYFIIDQELQTALILAATSGIRIDIIIPGIPDKKYVAIVSEHYYQLLLSVPNVYIHKYTKGFIHSKILYVDDEVSTVGTTNFDFRSLYLHFENTVWLYQSSALKDIYQYLDESMKSSELVSLSDLKKRNILFRLYQQALVGFSHLL